MGVGRPDTPNSAFFTIELTAAFENTDYPMVFFPLGSSLTLIIPVQPGCPAYAG